MRTSTFHKTLFCFLSLLYINLPHAKGQEAIECNYTDGTCLSIGYVLVQFVEGNPDRYAISVDYHIIQGGENDCPAISQIRFTPSFQGSGDIDIGDEEEIIGSATFEVVASTFEAQDRTLTMTVDYEEGQNEQFDLQLPESGECGEIVPLPVELISFDGAVTKEGVELSWSTASEQDNSHFEIERSADGKAFEQVGKVDGHGNSNTKISYSFTDHIPLTGQSYYRLKQVDFNGQHEYSKVIAVSVGADGADALQVVLAPNPCPNGNCQISIRNAGGAQETRLELTDLSGRLLYTTTVRHDSNRTAVLPVQALQGYKGLYILSAVSGDKVVRQRVVLE